MTRILVVEDEPGIALALEDDLKSDGYDVDVVRDGQTATERARQQSFDLILLDVMLPRKDGFCSTASGSCSTQWRGARPGGMTSASRRR